MKVNIMPLSRSFARSSFSATSCGGTSTQSTPPKGSSHHSSRELTASLYYRYGPRLIQQEASVPRGTTGTKYMQTGSGSASQIRRPSQSRATLVLNSASSFASFCNQRLSKSRSSDYLGPNSVRYQSGAAVSFVCPNAQNRCPRPVIRRARRYS